MNRRPSIPHAFRKFFSEIGDRRDRSKGEKRDLYSVDPAVSKNRFFSTVRTVLRAQASYPSSEESDLSLWRPDHEQADRPEIVSAVASFVDGLKHSRGEKARLRSERWRRTYGIMPRRPGDLTFPEEERAPETTAQTGTEKVCPLRFLSAGAAL
jgi:hypothetical protein